jgi:hypothetical protein
MSLGLFEPILGATERSRRFVTGGNDEAGEETRERRYDLSGEVH